MRQIKNYEEFNEGWKSGLVGGAMAMMALTGCKNNTSVEVYNKGTETIDNKSFGLFRVVTLPGDNDVSIYISKDSVITTNWSVTVGKQTNSYCTVTCPDSISRLYYDHNFLCNNAFSKDSMDNHRDKADMEKIESNDEYDILRSKDGFLSNIYWAFNDKGYQNKENEFMIDGKKYTYLKYNTGGFFGETLYFVIPVKKTTTW